MSEKINWTEEAKGIIADVQNCVSQIAVSEKVQSDISAVYLNIETLEFAEFTVKLSVAGFTIVGETLDNNSLEGCDKANRTFETIYALLQSVSPQYISAFAQDLSSKLTGLADPPSN